MYIETFMHNGQLTYATRGAVEEMIRQQKRINDLALLADTDFTTARDALAHIAQTTPYSFMSQQAFDMAINRISADKLARHKSTPLGKMEIENEFWHQWMGDK